MDKENRKTRKKSSTVQGGGVKPDLMLDVVGVLLMLLLVLLLDVVVLMLLLNLTKLQEILPIIKYYNIQPRRK